MITLLFSCAGPESLSVDTIWGTAFHQVYDGDSPKDDAADVSRAVPEPTLRGTASITIDDQFLAQVWVVDPPRALSWRSQPRGRWGADSQAQSWLTEGSAVDVDWTVSDVAGDPFFRVSDAEGLLMGLATLPDGDATVTWRWDGPDGGFTGRVGRDKGGEHPASASCPDLRDRPLEVTSDVGDELRLGHLESGTLAIGAHTLRFANLGLESNGRSTCPGVGGAWWVERAD